MAGKTNAVTVIILIIISIALLFFNSLFLFGSGLQRTVLNYDFYEEVLSETEFSESLVDGLTDEIYESIEEDGTGLDDEMPDEMEEEMLNTFVLTLEETFDSEWMDGVILEVINNSLGYIKGDDESLGYVDISDKKQDFENNLLSNIEESMGGVQPIANDEIQISDFMESNGFPDKIELDHLFGEGTDESSIDDGINTFQTIYSLMIITPFIVFSAFLVIFLLIGGVTRGLKWFSSAILVSSAVVALFLMILKLNITKISELLMEGSSFGGGLIQTSLDIFIGKAVFFPLVFIILSFIVLVGTIIFEKIKKGNGQEGVKQSS